MPSPRALAIQPEEMALQLLHADYGAAWFHVFLRVQLWKSAVLSIWQGEYSLEAGMPGEFHQLRDI